MPKKNTAVIQSLYRENSRKNCPRIVPPPPPPPLRQAEWLSKGIINKNKWKKKMREKYSTQLSRFFIQHNYTSTRPYPGIFFGKFMTRNPSTMANSSLGLRVWCSRSACAVILYFNSRCICCCDRSPSGLNGGAWAPPHQHQNTRTLRTPD